MKRLLPLLALLAVSSVEAALPPYRLKFVEYIESNSDKLAYIDTGYTPNAGTEIEMEFAFTRTDLTLKTYVFGVYGTGGGRFQFSYGPDNCLFGFGNNYDNNVTGFAYDTNRHVIRYVTGEGFYLDGTQVVASCNLATWAGTGKPLFLGAINSNGGTVNTSLIAPLRIYSCKIWSNGALVRNFLPAQTDSAAVLYDTVHRKIYSNANGSGGNFVASTEEMATDYRKATCIEANRTAYIAMGYWPNANTKLKMEFSFIEAIDTKTYVFGSYGTSGGRFQFSYGPASTGCFLGYGNTYTNSFVISPYDTKRHVVEYVPGSGKGFYFDGNRIAPPKTNLTTWKGTGANLLLGGVNPNGGDINMANCAPIRIYSCKIWEGNEMKRDLVPRQRVLDGKSGLYDNVTGNFYAYYGSGDDFTAVIPGLTVIFW